MKTIMLSTLIILVCMTSPSGAALYELEILGSDAIFLAGRSDVIVPPAGDPWDTGTYLARHMDPTPEEIQETHPMELAVTPGAIVTFCEEATGGVNFFNGFGPPFFDPNGNGVDGSHLQPLDGISGYMGPQGPLAGVFLDDSIPNTGPAPDTLDFTPFGLGTDFLSISPQLRQVFYIGDGFTGIGDTQQFIAPPGATRLCIGIPDGFGFVGHPGAYDDNDGSYTIGICAEVPLMVDIKPTSCPNPLNIKSNGVLPVAILGSAIYDVNDIDVASIRLEGVEPIRSAYEDVAGPVTDPNECACTEAGPDGFLDLTLKFEKQAVVAAIGEVEDGEVLPLMLTGVTYDEIPVEGSDCVWIRNKNRIPIQIRSKLTKKR